MDDAKHYAIVDSNDLFAGANGGPIKVQEAWSETETPDGPITHSHWKREGDKVVDLTPPSMTEIAGE